MKYLVGLFCAAMTLLGASSIDVAVASDANYRATPYRGEFSDWVPGQRGGHRNRDWDDWGGDRDGHHRRGRDRDDDRAAGVCSPRDESCCFNHSRRGPESITLTSGQSICGALKKLTPGGTIFLTPGSYTGGFTVWSPVTIQGPATSRHEEYYQPHLSSSSGRYRPKPVITGTGNCMMIDDRVTGSVYVSGVDFRLSGASSAGNRKKPACLVVNGGAFTLQSSTVSVQSSRSVPTAGILLHGGNVHIERSRVEGARYGIFVGESWRGGSFYIVESTITRNSTGLRVQGLVDVHVFGNTIENNGQRGSDGDGIVIDGGGGTFISNSIYGNNGNGIVLNEDVQNPRFLTNDISDNQRAGIYAPFGGEARFESNTVTYNRGEGFRCAQEPCPTFGSDNILEGNAGDCKSSFFKSCDRKKSRNRDSRRGGRDRDDDRDRDNNRYESRKRDRDRNGYLARREKAAKDDDE